MALAREDEGKTTIWILLKKELKNKDMIYKGGETPLLLAVDEGARGRGERGGQAAEAWEGPRPERRGVGNLKCYFLSMFILL
jgi:hypothetical protein